VGLSERLGLTHGTSRAELVDGLGGAELGHGPDGRPESEHSRERDGRRKGRVRVKREARFERLPFDDELLSQNVILITLPSH
jgi:hypothetical protein